MHIDMDTEGVYIYSTSVCSSFWVGNDTISRVPRVCPLSILPRDTNQVSFCIFLCALRTLVDILGKAAGCLGSLIFSGRARPRGRHGGDRVTFRLGRLNYNHNHIDQERELDASQ